jgi:hypothetical protein
MKKIFTLLFTAGLFTASYAQENHGHHGDYGRNDQYATSSNGHYDNRDPDRYDHHNYDQRNRSYANQRQMQMERINREYSYKVMSIQRNWYMTNRQKRLAIRDAKNERNYKIQMINRRLSGYANNSYGNNGYGRHEDDDRR